MYLHAYNCTFFTFNFPSNIIFFCAILTFLTCNSTYVLEIGCRFKKQCSQINTKSVHSFIKARQCEKPKLWNIQSYLLWIFLHINCFRSLRNKKMLYCSARTSILLCIAAMTTAHENNETCKLLFFISLMIK